MTLHVVEPHPSAPTKTSSRVYGYGRGGAGNYKKYANSELTVGPEASGPASIAEERRKSSLASSALERRVSFRPTSNGGHVVLSGRGGAGNARPAEERRIFDFDEELERQNKLLDSAAACPVFYVGRGGSGNMFSERDDARKSRQGSDVSTSSTGSGIAIRKSFDAVRGRLARAMSKE